MTDRVWLVSRPCALFVISPGVLSSTVILQTAYSQFVSRDFPTTSICLWKQHEVRTHDVPGLLRGSAKEKALVSAACSILLSFLNKGCIPMKTPRRRHGVYMGYRRMNLLTTESIGSQIQFPEVHHCQTRFVESCIV